MAPVCHRLSPLWNDSKPTLFPQAKRSLGQPSQKRRKRADGQPVCAIFAALHTIAELSIPELRFHPLDYCQFIINGLHHSSSRMTIFINCCKLLYKFVQAALLLVKPTIACLAC
jgi:hypothetical protein